MKSKRFLQFALKVIVVHTATYFVCGALAYCLFTKPFYEGPDAVFSPFMRSPDNPAEWSHVMHWFLVAQVVRGLLMAVVLYALFDALANFSYRMRWFVVSGIYVVFGYWAAAVASPGTIEGMVYMKPYITMYLHTIVQPEIVVQGIALGAWLAWWMVPKAVGSVPARKQLDDKRVVTA